MPLKLAPGSPDFEALRILKRGGRQLTYTEQLAVPRLIAQGLVTAGPLFHVTQAGSSALDAVEAQVKSRREQERDEDASESKRRRDAAR